MWRFELFVTGLSVGIAAHFIFTKNWVWAAVMLGCVAINVGATYCAFWDEQLRKKGGCCGGR